MICVPWSLRWASQAVRPAEAWLVPGHEPLAWLSHLAEAIGDVADLELYVLPMSRQRREPAGILAVPSKPTVCRSPGLMIPYGRISTLFLPVDALLWPPMSEQELTRALNCEINIFHPTIGLVGFSRTECFRISQLLEAPKQRHANWSLARPGSPPAAKLVGVMPIVPPNPQQVIDEGRDDIGEEPLENAPPPPEESGTPPLVKGAAKAPLATFAMVLQKFAERLKSKKRDQNKPPETKSPASGAKPQPPGYPAKPPGPGLGDMLSNFMSKAAKAISNLTPHQYAALAAAMQKHRDREIHRLLSLLQNNPDQGLRYALPLSNLNNARGLATPSGQLSERNTNFDMSQIGRSGRGDAWMLSYDIQEQLRNHYRRLATRELQLGRHRRAAYIFAQLLGDFASAANALKQGRHFREAAVLFRDRLNQKQAAADCLEQGGLLLEAIPLLEELSSFERAGDLYAKLEQHEEAAACYRKEVAKLISHDLEMRAAELLENKLHAPREALALLESVWTKKLQAAACLKEVFHLLARLKDFDGARERITRFRTTETSPHLVLALAHALAEVATVFPEDKTRHLAADTTKVVIGKRLAGYQGGNVEAMTSVLNILAPADKLLARDTQRYARQLAPKPVAPRVVAAGITPQRKSLGRPPLRSYFDLPQGVQWQAFVPAGAVFYGIGTQFDSTVVMRCSWNGHASIRTLGMLKVSDYTVNTGAHGVVYCANPSQLWAVHFPHGARHGAAGFPSTDDADAVEITMPWLPQNALAVTIDEQQNAWVLHNEVRETLDPVLSTHDPNTGRLIATHSVDLTQTPVEHLQVPVPMVARSNHVYFALGNRILTLAYGSRWETTTLPRHVTHMVASHPLTRMRVAAGLATGGVVFTDGLESNPVGEGLDYPILAFSRGGALVAASKSEVRYYRMSGARPDYRGSWPGYDLDASMTGAAILPTDRMDELAVISPGGLVRIISLPD